MEISIKRRIQIFVTGFLPLIGLSAMLGMAFLFGLNPASVFTNVEPRDASNYVMVTKVFGIPLKTRPATQADLRQDDEDMRIAKIVILSGGALAFSMALVMCFSSVTCRPKKVLQWFDRNLGSVQWSFKKRR